MNALSRYADPIYSILRLFFGLMFVCHGLYHVFGMFGGKPGGESFFVVGGWIEIVTGFLIAIGLLTRPAAFLASGTMAVAYFKMHFPHSPLPIVNHGEAAVLYCFVFLFAFFYGAGRWSIDALIGGNRAAASSA
jgi:putative oxidoreductase